MQSIIECYRVFLAHLLGPIFGLVVGGVNLYIDDAKVGPQLKGHVKHVHLGTRSAREERQKCSERLVFTVVIAIE